MLTDVDLNRCETLIQTCIVGITVRGKWCVLIAQDSTAFRV